MQLLLCAGSFLVQGVSALAEAFQEEGTKDVRLLALGKEALVELLDFFVDIGGIGTEDVDAVDHAHDQAREDSRRVGGMGGNVEVQI